MKTRLFSAVALILLFTALLCGCTSPTPPPDGNYTADAILSENDSGVSVQSPAEIRVEDGQIYATIVWIGASYDSIVVDGDTYSPVDGGFEIPIDQLDIEIPVTACANGAANENFTVLFDFGTLREAE